MNDTSITKILASVGQVAGHCVHGAKEQVQYMVDSNFLYGKYVPQSEFDALKTMVLQLREELQKLQEKS